MRAHLVQLDIAWEDHAANHARVRELLAPVAPGDLVVLPEMFDTGFSMNTERTAPHADDTLAFLADLARDLGATIQGGRTVVAAPHHLAHNRAPVLGPDGRLLAEYTKIHPFSYGKEHERFEGGTEVLTYDWHAGTDTLRVCPAICYDLRFPELFRRGLRLGAEVFAIGANWPAARAHHWRALLIARAIENQAVVLGVNRTGRDPSLAYAGGSLAVASTGEILGELGEREAVLSLDIDPAAIRGWRERFPAWRDARLP